MELYLLRHGLAQHGLAEQRPAEERSATHRDSDRVLTAEGIVQLQRVMELARDAGVRPSLIASSPYARAKQTAAIAARTLEYRGKVLHSPAFAPDSSPFRAWEEVRAHDGETSLLVAAHEPLLSSTVAWFAGSTREMIRFVPAAMVRIDFAVLGPHPQGVMRWMISPELVAHF
jgi:phosphohistidine phosphatase